MSKLAALRVLKKELHVSHSQVFTYLACPQKYKFSYVEQRPVERVSINLLFGSAIHKALEVFWRSIQQGQKEPLSSLEQAFEIHLQNDLKQREQPIVYKKGLPDEEGCLDMGKKLLKAFIENICTDGFQVVDVEAPLSARLYDVNGQTTDFNLVGVIDLILMDEAGILWAIDHKTAAQPYSQAKVNLDGQLSAYAYLLAANKYVSRLDEVHLRFDVLRKLKTPKLEHYETLRTPKDRRTFAKLVCAVLNAIDYRVFYPNRSWMCLDCQHKDACNEAW